MVCKINKDGSRFWCNENGKRHRLGGPAVVYSNGDKDWYQNGKLHREDGPAVEWATGSRKEYYINGFYYTQSDWRKYNGM